MGVGVKVTASLARPGALCKLDKMNGKRLWSGMLDIPSPPVGGGLPDARAPLAEQAHSASLPPRRDSWKRLAPMAVAYSLGTFNDNFFKQTVLFLAIAAGRESIQSLGTLLFALPFIACSAWAGWLADRISKQRIMFWAKALEILAAVVGGLSLYFMSFTGMVIMIFIMAVQSTLFSPAINGAIPENFTTAGVSSANAVLKMSTTASVLCGIALAGLVLDLPAPPWLTGGSVPFGRLAAGAVVALTAAIGLAATIFLPRQPAPPPSAAPFPWLGAWDSVRHAREFYIADRPLLLALCAEAFFYFMGALAVLIINNLGINEYHLSQTHTGYLSAAMMVGICLGSLAAARVPAGRWQRSLLPAGALMAVTFLAVPSIHFLPEAAHFTGLSILFLLTGAGGGFFLIPTVSFIQIRPPVNARGKTLGVSNFLSFCGVALSGAVFLPLALLTPSWGLCACGGITVLFLGAMFLQFKKCGAC